jgi:hypothetical protein
MRLGLKTLLAALLAAALVVPAATAKSGGGPGHGKSGGGGKPAWAGGGGHGKPEWAGQGAGHGKKAEKAPKAKGDETAETEQLEEPLHDNPAFICKFEREMGDEVEFAEKYGTNDNKANAFGMCVSEKAHARTGGSEEAQPEEASECTAPAVEEEQADSGEPAAGGEPEGVDEGGSAEECQAAGGQTGEDADVEPGEEGEGEDEETSDGSESSETSAVLTALRLLF